MITIILHTENIENLKNFFSFFNKNYRKNKFNILIHAKNYQPWDDGSILKEITSFNSYYCYNTTKSKISSLIELIYKTKDNEFILVDEIQPEFYLEKNTTSKFNYLYFGCRDILNKNLDTKYESVKWFIIDCVSQILNKKLTFDDGSSDSIRYYNKIQDKIFFEKIIYIDGGLGDHVMALPLIESLSPEIFVSCKYPHLFQHFKLKGFIDWNNDLFGGYERSVYEYGSNNNTDKIIDTFFKMYGYDRTKKNVLKYNGNFESNEEIETEKNIALICTSAAKINGIDSNKDWKDIRWLKLVNELKKKNYYVIQVGTSKDDQIPTVDKKFLDKPLPNLCGLIKNSSLWISVDTFFHHFAASIKPNVGICLTPFYNNHAKHPGVIYVEKDCGKNYYDRRWWLDLQQPERKECMELIQVEDILKIVKK